MKPRIWSQAWFDGMKGTAQEDSWEDWTAQQFRKHQEYLAMLEKHGRGQKSRAHVPFGTKIVIVR